MNRAYAWTFVFGLVGAALLVAYATSPHRMTALDWFLTGATAVVALTWAVETLLQEKDHR